MECILSMYSCISWWALECSAGERYINCSVCLWQTGILEQWSAWTECQRIVGGHGRSTTDILTCSALSREELRMERKWKIPQLPPPLLSGERKWKASCPENVEHMQILPSVGFILVVVLVFRQHIFVCVGRGGGVLVSFLLRKWASLGAAMLAYFLRMKSRKGLVGLWQCILSNAPVLFPMQGL